MRLAYAAFLASLMLPLAAFAADQTIGAAAAGDPLNRFNSKSYWQAFEDCHISASIGMMTINRANTQERAERELLISDLRRRGIARIAADRGLPAAAAQKFFEDNMPQSMLTGFLAPCQALIKAHDAKFGAPK